MLHPLQLEEPFDVWYSVLHADQYFTLGVRLKNIMSSAHLA
jgi:hypothetical protein